MGFPYGALRYNVLSDSGVKKCMEIHYCIPWVYGLREITGQHSDYGHTLKMLDRNIVTNCCYHIFLVTAILLVYTTHGGGFQCPD